MRFSWAVAAVALVAGVTLGPAAAPVSAHSGGKANVLVADLTLTPVGTAWTVATTLVDGDSGSPIRGAEVHTLLGDPAKTFTLTPGSTLGNYNTSVGALAAGPTHLELKVQTLPGAAPVVPYDHTWDFTLTAGQPYTVVSGSAGGSGSNVALIMSVAGAVILLALLYGLFSLRRRTAAPAKKR
jgi:hypothetical protein